MSTLKRLVALTLSLLMLLPCLGGAAAAEQEPNPYVELLETMTIQEAYDEYVSLLNMYLNNDPETPVDIGLLSLAFDQVNWAYSFEFSLYTQVLALLEENNFADAMDWLLVLQISNEEFEAHLVSEEFRKAYFNILGTDVLAIYLEARRQEAAHNESSAGELYKQCLRFFDAKERYTSNRIDLDTLVDLVQQQIADGDYAKAVENAQRLIDSGHEKGQALYKVAYKKLQQAEAATPVPLCTNPVVPETTDIPPAQVITPVPSQSTASSGFLTVKSYYNKSNISLSWDAVPGANEYRVYRARGVDGQYKQIASITKTSYQDYDFVKGIFNGYYVEALSNGQVLKTSDRFTVYAEVATPTPRPTATPTPKPTATPTPKPTATPTPKPTPTPAPVWGAWSGWSTTAVSASSTRQVETKVESVAVYGTKYSYNRWTYTNINGGTNWSYAYYVGSFYAGNGRWEYASAMSPFPSAGSVDGQARYQGASGYSGYWYNPSTSQVQTGTKNVTYYRYRDLQK